MLNLDRLNLDRQIRPADARGSGVVMRGHFTSSVSLLLPAVILALICASCAKTNPTGWTPEDLAALPEASLVPPGARATRLALIDGKDRVTVDKTTRVTYNIGFDQPYDATIVRDRDPARWAP
jgi:hypothetical protein